MYSSQGIEKGLKMFNACQEKGIFQVWSDYISSFSQGKKLFWNDSHIFPLESIPTQQFKVVHLNKWFKNTWKQSWNSKSKVTSKSAGACSAHNPLAKLSIFCYSQFPTDQKVM